MITLKSDLIRVELPDAGEKPNDTQRFDRAGFIAEVVFDGAHHFCASEPLNLVHPSSGGRGLCCEWVLDVSGEAGAGEYYPKFGVGLIRKEDEGRYSFARKYKDVVPFEVSREYTDDTAVFTTEGMPCLGYALKSAKTVSVVGNTVTLVTRARNVGEKTINMQEYCHNFLSIDGMALGSDYVLDLPGVPDQGNRRMKNLGGSFGSFRGHGRGVTFCEYSAVATHIGFKPEELDSAVPFTWTLSHLGAGLYVRGEEYFTPSAVSVWAIDHIVSPEINVGFAIAPGEAYEWKRRWEFGYLP